MRLSRKFGDDALAYFTERVDPEVIRRRAAETLKVARYNKVVEETAFIGLAIDGTGAGHITKTTCPLGHPIKDSNDKVTGHNHHVVMISVVEPGSPCRSIWNPTPPATVNTLPANAYCNER